MKKQFLKILNIFILLEMRFSTCEPVFQNYILSSAVGLCLSTIPLNFFYFNYFFPNRCEEIRSNYNSTAFNILIDEYLYGQHLAKMVVSNSLRAHFSRQHPTKALVMSFHGWTGSGKNYMSKLIADQVFGSSSSFVHWYIATRDFPHESDITLYRKRLQKEIPEYTKNCGTSLFIFDELDKMPPGVIDAIKPFIDFYNEINGVDYRRNVFVFLSNAGGRDITKVAFNFWLDGKDREDINMRHIEPLVNKEAFYEKGGLQQSDIVKMNLIDAFVPFLPLERRHVKQCIHHELGLRQIDIDEPVVDKIANEIIYYPPELEIYSVSGCKKVSPKVDLYY